MMKGVTPSHGETERSRSENSLQGAREAPGSGAPQERDPLMVPLYQDDSETRKITPK